ncbi:MAG: methylated-DNA--[protein]-cysteine S-methyltransferase [Methanotrichaceae archaeon]
MTEGAYFQDIGYYLLIERSGNVVKRIFFSSEPPSEHSELAERIIRNVVDGAPCSDIELDFSGLTEFQRKVLSIVRNIPPGVVMTYGDVAAMAGSPGAARAVGRVMASNPFAIVVPCHRVVAKQGLGGYSCGLSVKKKLLELEKDVEAVHSTSDNERKS